MALSVLSSDDCKEVHNSSKSKLKELLLQWYLYWDTEEHYIVGMQ